MTNPVTAVLRHKGHDEVHSISADASALDAVRRMNEEAIGSLLVTDGDRVVGIFTKRDVLRRIIDRGLDPSKTRVDEVMTWPVLSVRPSTTVAEAMQLMTERSCRHLPVLDKGRAIGLVSNGDLTRWLVDDQRTEIKDLTEYVQGTYPR